jgi:hypothetical protein
VRLKEQPNRQEAESVAPDQREKKSDTAQDIDESEALLTYDGKR